VWTSYGEQIAHYGEQIAGAAVAIAALAVMLAGFEWLKNSVAHYRLWIAGGTGVFMSLMPYIDPTFPLTWWEAIDLGLFMFAFYGVFFHLDLIFLAASRAIRKIVGGE
jgi:hypothetical protein